MQKPPHPVPRLPLFFVEKWHKVRDGRHLIFLSLICSVFGLLPVAAIGIAMAYGARNDLAYYVLGAFAAPPTPKSNWHG